MATPTPPTTPAPAPTPTPAPAPSEWKNPATYLHLLAVILTGLFASGTLPATSEASRIATIIALILGSLGYPVVTSVASSAAARNSEIRARVVRVAAGVATTGAAFVLALAIGGAALSSQACGGAQSFGSCSISVLESDVGNGTLAAAVNEALDQGDYLGAIAQLIGKVGAQEVACAVIAISDANSGTGSGSAAPAGSGAPQVRVELVAQRKVRADAVIAKYNWRGTKK